jgi:hypothetical protein
VTGAEKREEVRSGRKVETSAEQQDYEYAQRVSLVPSFDIVLIVDSIDLAIAGIPSQLLPPHYAFRLPFYGCLTEW